MGLGKGGVCTGTGEKRLEHGACSLLPALPGPSKSVKQALNKKTGVVEGGQVPGLSKSGTGSGWAVPRPRAGSRWPYCV